jgi:hypothetical protein
LFMNELRFRQKIEAQQNRHAADLLQKARGSNRNNELERTCSRACAITSTMRVLRRAWTASPSDGEPACPRPTV